MLADSGPDPGVIKLLLFIVGPNGNGFRRFLGRLRPGLSFPIGVRRFVGRFRLGSGGNIALVFLLALIATAFEGFWADCGPDFHFPQEFESLLADFGPDPGVVRWTALGGSSGFVT